MNYWLRLYTGILDDPKVHFLSDEHFRGWVLLLCVAKEYDGILPDLRRVAFRLRVSETEAKELIQELKRSGFIDEDGDRLKLHNWDKRQYKSDVSTERVKRYRNAERNVSETPPETEYRAENRDRAEQSARDAQPAARAKRAAARQPKMCDEEYLEELQQNPAYAVFDVKIIYHKMAAWCRRNHKQPTQKRLLAWLNREDRPMAANSKSPKKLDVGAPAPSAPVPTAEINGFMAEHIEGLIAAGDIIQLGHEYDDIVGRGGAKAEWEIRLVAYFEQYNSAT